MNCPICQKPLLGDIILNDIFCEHIRHKQCNIEAFTDETLDICSMLPTNLLLTINVLNKLKTLKHLYITQPYNNQFKKLVEALFPKDLVQISKNQTNKEEAQFLKDVSNLSSNQKILQVKIPPKAKVEEALLQIPFENLSQTIIAITLLKRDLVPQDTTQLLDVDSVLSRYGVYFDKELFNKAVSESNQVLTQDSTSFTYKTYRAQIYDYQTQNNASSNDKIYKLRNDSSTRQGGTTSYAPKSDSFVTCELNDDFDENIKIIPTQTKQYDWVNQMNKLKDKVIAYFQSNTLEQSFEGIIFDKIMRTIHILIRRRFMSISTKQDIREIMITLLPKLETIDGVKVTNEMRQSATKYCYKFYSFPHETMFPQMRLPTQQTTFSMILKSIGVNQNEVIIQKKGNITNGVSIVKQWHYNPSFPLKYQSMPQLNQIDAISTLKATLVQKASQPKYICLSSNSSTNEHICQKQTGNLPVFCQDPLNIGRYTVLKQFNDLLLAGTDCGQVIGFDPNMCYQEQINLNSYVDENHYAYPGFFKTSAIIGKDKYKEGITAISTFNDTICFSSLSGKLYVQNALNLGNDQQIIDCGFVPNSIDILQNDILATGQGGAFIFDISKQQFTQLFKMPIQSQLTSSYQQSAPTDPGYYDYTSSRFISSNQVLLTDSIGGVRIFDLRSNTSTQIRLSSNISVSSFDLVDNDLVTVQSNCLISAIDLRSPSTLIERRIGKVMQLSQTPQVKFMAQKRVVLSLPHQNNFLLLENQNLKILNEFQIRHLSSEECVIKGVQPVNKYDFGFILQTGVESGVYVAKTMEPEDAI
ncbi:Conserved_hypothetical protein [Hexamita inflata]|uniref:Uncharacterized protein n=1 Tax=Hexamita inflata TaxID=28002 RepID=A0ABP1GUL4_9EUKA